MADVSETDLATFVGSRAGYYLSAWRPIRSGEVRRGKFNGAAFFLSGTWLLYRRLYGAAALLALITIIESMVSGALFWRAGLAAPPKSYTLLMTFVYTSITGLYGNRLYYNHTVRQIRALQSRGPASEQLLASHGGTSWMGVLVGSLIYILLLVLISAYAR